MCEAVDWNECPETEYREMLEVLPPALWTGDGFLVGEPMDHHSESGEPRYSAYLVRKITHVGWSEERYYRASRPMTVAEFRKVGA